MNLLPKDHKEFSSKEYWNEFFSKQKFQHFEWYGEYDSLNEILDKYIYTKDKVLITGCGNSKLSADLYDVGICKSVSIDINAPVINQMKEKYGKDRPKMVFEQMDVFKMTYDPETFAVVIDKGTLDALLVDDSKETSDKIDKMFSEIERVLRYGGREWLLRFHRCIKAEAKHENSVAFPVFIVVATKMKKMLGSSMVLEIVHDGVPTPKRCLAKTDIVEYVNSLQQYAFLKHYLGKKKVTEDDICLELCSPDTGMVKYKMFVVDREETASLKFAIFVVPQGRETEWLFSSPQGRRELAASANCERLVVVHLLRNNVYTDLDEVKKDLSESVLELAPTSCKAQVPILSLGNDVGKRDIKCCGKSDISGEYIIEDVGSGNGDMYRRLIFLCNPYSVQSEAKLILGQKKKKKKTVSKLEIDFDYLAHDYNVAIISGLALIESEMLNPKILDIGLGGGTLAMYLYKHFPDATIEAVELDPAILEVSKKWFSLTTDMRLRVHIADGLTFIQEAAKKGSQYDAIILDVDNKDPTLGISGPPIEFLELSLLNNLKKIVSDKGDFYVAVII
ncbi:eEF1A lysine and N-terminal methyltransferase-like isoform X2 [Stegodyphus dumicola]|uniref:eEF1A lysine and N-terminal methyltransferase-like isoform X2 n=1 Tax=Stegodyphus dumicola TaxID=202533 RepID=UPI0015B26992|nr:eEF1A lysine and N-terminal methyltransferase-like isoform X2 [Stegodyphus dumicola]